MVYIHNIIEAVLLVYIYFRMDAKPDARFGI